MSSRAEPRSGIIFEGVAFNNDLVEVTFTEPPDRGDGVARLQTVVVDAERKVPEEYARLIEALIDLVDEARIRLRNPPDKFTRSD